MKRLKIIKVVLVIFLFSTILIGAEKKDQLIVTYDWGRVHSKPSAFSKQKARLQLATLVTVLSKHGDWVKIKYPVVKNKKLKKHREGYIHSDALINKKQYEKQKRAVQDRVSKLKAGGFSEEDEVTAGVKGLSEEDEVTAGTKGLSEDDEVTAGTKGLSEDDEVTAGTKGFNPKVEAEYKKKMGAKAYSKVDKFEKAGSIQNIQKRFKRWRKKGRLGEYNKGFYTYPGKKGGKK